MGQDELFLQNWKVHHTLFRVEQFATAPTTRHELRAFPA